MASVRTTITLPLPLHTFATAEARRLSQKKRGDSKPNLSLLFQTWIEEAKQKREQEANQPA